MDEPMIFAVRRYIFRCRQAGDRRSVSELLREIASPADAERLARMV